MSKRVRPTSRSKYNFVTNSTSSTDSSRSKEPQYYIDYEALKAQMQSILPYHKTLIKDLPARESEKFYALKELVSGAQKVDDSTYANIVKISKEVFGSIGEISPGTVGSFFSSCYTPTGYTDVKSAACSEECMKSLQSVDGGEEKCELHVFKFNGRRLKMLSYSGESNTALIHMSKHAIGTKIPESGIDELYKYDVKHVIFVHKNVPSRKIPIEQLAYKTGGNYPKTSGSSLIATIIFLIAIVLTIIITVGLLRTYGSRAAIIFLTFAIIFLFIVVALRTACK